MELLRLTVEEGKQGGGIEVMDVELTPTAHLELETVEAAVGAAIAELEFFRDSVLPVRRTMERIRREGLR